MSDGFHEAGVCETRWAIENEVAAAEAFRKNHPNAVVFADDCNLLLKLVMEVICAPGEQQRIIVIFFTDYIQQRAIFA